MTPMLLSLVLLSKTASIEADTQLSMPKAGIEMQLNVSCDASADEHEEERTLDQLFLLLSQVVRNLVSTFHLSAMNIDVRKLSPPLQHGPLIHLPRPVELTTKQRNSSHNCT